MPAIQNTRFLGRIVQKHRIQFASDFSRYVPSGAYSARLRVRGKRIRKPLKSAQVGRVVRRRFTRFPDPAERSPVLMGAGLRG